MIDKTEWAIVHVGPLTASGQDEIVGRFIFKQDAQQWLKDYFGVGEIKARRRGLEIRRLSMEGPE